jgi:anti-sigma regulatory factor (Ser/Thr protein kinase)
MRHRAAAFAAAAGAPDDMTHAVEIAVSEIVTNAVLHAYVGRDEPGSVSVRCESDGERVTIVVRDDGVGLSARDDSPGVGHGMVLVGGLAQTLDVTAGPDGSGTVVTMSFAPAAAEPVLPGLEPLCALALDSVADVSCVDVVCDGVLRRVAAEVRGDQELTTWLGGALPRSKPGTATWAALQEGGLRLTVHDPSVPRSPGGTGERLGLIWWVSVPLKRADGQLAALWSLGGREDGRPVPSQATMRTLADAGRKDLADESRRAMLRAQLA